jgi:hypothetical protein
MRRVLLCKKGRNRLGPGALMGWVIRPAPDQIADSFLLPRIAVLACLILHPELKTTCRGVIE